ncbi:MAG: arginine--tRNA ligase [Clostridia bacterium]|nr:arginine--tRNA ligase [Clostridia bacterium]
MDLAQVKQEIASLLNIEGVDSNEAASYVVIPQDTTLGDYALPCFRFAKALRKSPVVIAQDLASELSAKAHPFKKIEAVNGYLNFTLDRNAEAGKILSEVILKGASYGDSDEGAGKTICIDYSSINIAKPFHIGHLSTTVIGGALYKMYKKLGYNAVGINHLGDWGTQFGKLIVAYKMWGDTIDIEKEGMLALTKIYVKFHEEAEKDPTLDDKARYWFKQIEDGNEEALSLFNMFKELTLKEVGKVYDRLDITFDSYNGEAFYNDKMAPVLDELRAQNLVTVSEGAEIVDLSEYNMSPCLLVKADGATLYATRDLAAAFYRKNTYDFYKCLYVVAYQQNLHFKQVFKVIELMGKDWHKDLVHVPFGMVSLEDGTMSTRKGKVVWLKDVLDKAVEKSYAIMSEKNANLKNKEEVAEKVGVGAVIFFALSNNRIKDITFSYDKVLTFDGETGPYVQYTNARARSILRKAGALQDELNKPFTSEELEGLSGKEGEELISLISRFRATVSDAVAKYEPSIVTRYVIDIAKSFNRYYLNNRILNAEEKYVRARLGLVYATHVVIEEALRLLGIKAPEEM